MDAAASITIGAIVAVALLTCGLFYMNAEAREKSPWSENSRMWSSNPIPLMEDGYTCYGAGNAFSKGAYCYYPRDPIKDPDYVRPAQKEVVMWSDDPIPLREKGYECNTAGNAFTTGAWCVYPDGGMP